MLRSAILLVAASVLRVPASFGEIHMYNDLTCSGEHVNMELIALDECIPTPYPSISMVVSCQAGKVVMKTYLDTLCSEDEVLTANGTEDECHDLVRLGYAHSKILCEPAWNWYHISTAVFEAEDCSGDFRWQNMTFYDACVDGWRTQRLDDDDTIVSRVYEKENCSGNITYEEILPCQEGCSTRPGYGGQLNGIQTICTSLTESSSASSSDTPVESASSSDTPVDSFSASAHRFEVVIIVFTLLAYSLV